MMKRLYILSMLACAAVCTSVAMAESRSVTFDFSSPESLAAMGLPTPTSNNPTYLRDEIKIGEITFQPQSTLPRSTFYNGQYTFYTTNGNTFAFKADEGAVIKRVNFNGFYDQQRFTASPAGFDSGNTYWSGSATRVIFTGTGGNSLFSMTVEYEYNEPQEQYSQYDVNRDGAVNSADITAIYSYILNGSTGYKNFSDVNADRTINSADVTAIYQVILNGDTPSTVPAPTFSHPSGTVFYTPTDITISAPNAKIFITTDGTTPTTMHYFDMSSGSISMTVTSNITIKAIAVIDGKISPVATAVYTLEEAPQDNNLNANWKETSYNIPQSGSTATTNSATYNQAWRLEYPHINTSSNSMVVVHATQQYGITYSLELDKSHRANRWTCFTMHNGTPNNNVGRTTSTFSPDDCVPSSYQVQTNEYTRGNYTTQVVNDDGTNMVLFSRGHICASEDRQSGEEQNRQTFLTSNIHPQYQAHNAGLWQTMEYVVQNWGKSSSFRDTLYVCKGATIANVTLDGSTVSGTIPYSEVKSKYGVTLTGTLTIPRYWYMALLCYKNGQYHAMAYWTEQKNTSHSGTTLPQCMISIDELERRTGIDFFCNLPDDIEDDVEATVDTNFWK